MRNRKKLVKDALSIFVTLSITAVSTGASNALPLKENTQKGANAASNYIRNTKQKPTPLKLNLSSSSDNKQTQPKRRVCVYYIPDDQGGGQCIPRLCYYDDIYQRCE